MPRAKEISADAGESIDHLGVHKLTPLLQRLASQGVNFSHAQGLLSDNDYLARVTRSIKFGGWTMDHEEQIAADILGEEHFVTAEESNFLLGLDRFSGSVRYDLNTVKACKTANDMGQDWRLVFIHDISPLGLYHRLGGENFFMPPHGERSAKEVFERWERDFEAAGTRMPTIGYRLINFHPLYGVGFGATWEDFIRKIHREDRGRVDIAPANWVLEAWAVDYLKRRQFEFGQTSGGRRYSGSHHVVVGERPGYHPSYVGLCGFCETEREPGNEKKFLVHHFPFRPCYGSGVPMTVMRTLDEQHNHQ